MKRGVHWCGTDGMQDVGRAVVAKLSGPYLSALPGKSFAPMAPMFGSQRATWPRWAMGR
jgi:hypothetical protein